MFLQVCEWLGRLPALLTEGGALRAANKRRRIGQGLVDLHQGLSRLSENAASIESMIGELAQSSADERTWLVPHLKEAVVAQQLELAHASNLLWRHRAFLEIYGDRLWEHVEKITVGKGTLLQILASALRDDTDETIVLPRSLDLKTLEPFADREWRSALEHLRIMLMRNQRDEIGALLTVNLPLRGRESTRLRKHAQKLLDEVQRIKSSKRLQDTARDISKVIRTNFKVEELFR